MGTSARSSITFRYFPTLLPYLPRKLPETEIVELFIQNPEDWKISRKDRAVRMLDDPDLIRILNIPNWNSDTERALMWYEKRVDHQFVCSVLEIGVNINVKIEFFKWAAKVRHFNHDISTYVTLIRCLEEARLYGDIYETMEEVIRSPYVGFSPAVLFEFVKVFGRAKKMNEALSFFYKAKERKCRPTSSTYNSVILMLMKEGLHEKVHEVYAEMCNERDCFPDMVTYSALISSYEKLGRDDSAVSLFEEMKDNSLQPTEKIYTTLFGIYFKEGKVEKALHLFQEMKRAGCFPTIYTYTELIKGLGNAGWVEEAYGLYKDMLRDGLTPDVVFLIYLMNMLGKAGRVKDLRNVFNEMGMCSRINELEQSIHDLRAEMNAEGTPPSASESVDEPKRPVVSTFKAFTHKFF
ncbi:Pentatricopeptide repeat [Arabidopsis thaliana x Arabidopsis arenosa]|uniref:Pentatricopeptide repeat n=1 Tax=Arabidopsis thaliana x Arabidopsis arenosa TaxID=1240361 RepID=A0A8T1Z1A5_9BRAS|nr:Pentatricopeptide repeat [Arabidopsis thaliana x Arabidopsis arenosa]